jgi:tryptophanyl-tRNA synthetase
MQGQGYGKLKSAVAESLVEFLRPMQERYKQLRQDQAYLNSVLKLGAERAIKLSQPTLEKVHEVIGFVPKH